MLYYMIAMPMDSCCVLPGKLKNIFKQMRYFEESNVLRSDYKEATEHRFILEFKNQLKRPKKITGNFDFTFIILIEVTYTEILRKRRRNYLCIIRELYFFQRR